VSAVWIVVIILLVVAASVVVANIAVRRKGYSIPGKTIVSCSKGHLFTTTWVEGGSLKAVTTDRGIHRQYPAAGRALGADRGDTR